nr:MAG TPA: hypothetical protein [Bacteriophage sp.]
MEQIGFRHEKTRAHLNLMLTLKLCIIIILYSQLRLL